MDLEVTDLECRHGSRVVFSGVGFRVATGGLLVVHGPNGCGKSTLLRCLAGLTRPASGTIRIDSDQTAFLGHRSAVTEMTSVGDNLRFWANVHGYFGRDANSRTQAAAELLNIASHIDQPAGSLSAGQHRRLGIARICVAGRAVWLLGRTDNCARRRFGCRIQTTLAGSSRCRWPGSPDQPEPGILSQERRPWTWPYTQAWQRGHLAANPNDPALPPIRAEIQILDRKPPDAGTVPSGLRNGSPVRKQLEPCPGIFRAPRGHDGHRHWPGP